MNVRIEKMERGVVKHRIVEASYIIVCDELIEKASKEISLIWLRNIKNEDGPVSGNTWYRAGA